MVWLGITILLAEVGVPDKIDSVEVCWRFIEEEPGGIEEDDGNSGDDTGISGGDIFDEKVSNDNNDDDGDDAVIIDVKGIGITDHIEDVNDGR